MQKGTIKRLNEKGFGFIQREGEHKDLFFHSSELKNCKFNDLQEGETLEFEVDSGEKGQFARNITLVTN